MILPDVNVLIYILRENVPEHRKCFDWFSKIVNGNSAFGMSPQVLSSVIRVATHPKVFEEPSELKDLIEFSDSLINHPNCVRIVPGSRHWEIFTRLCVESNARGKLVPDAWFAALAIESGCEWITF
ncbi:MAG: type II toxin-antitoxin system VapC family toxin, partial [Candidatus Omnitrophica bacterium]|nr:type II toxin-antitoxin system VapC family toxin [Candidatus Omnitrophota bacterium]